MLYRRLLTYAWAAVVVGIFGWYLWHPGDFTAQNFERILAGWGPWAFPGFVVASFIRGPLLIPSTPVVLAGGAFFPEAIPAVLVVSMLGIVGSATLLYRFPGFAGYDKLLQAKHPEQLARLQVQLTKPWAIWLVAGWAFFPAVPTDLICYAAGLVRMPYRRMILGIIIGELPLVTAYILLGARIAQYLPF